MRQTALRVSTFSRSVCSRRSQRAAPCLQWRCFGGSLPTVSRFDPFSRRDVYSQWPQIQRRQQHSESRIEPRHEVERVQMEARSGVDPKHFQPLLRLAMDVMAGKRAAVSRAITKVESVNPEHFREGQLLLSYLLSLKRESDSVKAAVESSEPYSHEDDDDKEEEDSDSEEPNVEKLMRTTLRVGITGPPGAGKSTLVNKLGSMLCEEGYRVGVLPVDPSSFLSGGSILGDVTRMLELTQHPKAFVRPSPNRLTLGGVTDTTPEVITILESAGYDVILVETVGAGQAEVEVAHCVDLFAMVASPTGGDDLQGLKKGILEMADLVIVNKADSDLIKNARHVYSDYTRSIGMSRKRRGEVWAPIVRLASCMKPVDDKHYGVRNVWNDMLKFKHAMVKTGQFEQQRTDQLKYSSWQYVWRSIRQRVKDMHSDFEDAEQQLTDGLIPARQASIQILSTIWKHD